MKSAWPPQSANSASNIFILTRKNYDSNAVLSTSGWASMTVTHHGWPWVDGRQSVPSHIDVLWSMLGPCGDENDLVAANLSAVVEMFCVVSGKG